MSDSETTSHPAPDADASDDAEGLAEFDAGFAAGRDVDKKPARPAKTEPAETPREQAKSDADDDRIDVSRKEWAEIKAFAARAASYDQQFSKLFGTVGNISKKLADRVATEQAGTPAGRKVEIPKDAFADLERDFPEIALRIRGGVEKVVSGLHGTGGSDIDPARLKALVTEIHTEREIQALDDDFPDWREIVGAVDISQQQPDMNNPFRAWLAQQDLSYQQRINASDRASTIAEAIRRFRAWQKQQQQQSAQKPRDAARAERIRAAIQPKGDAGGSGTSSGSDDDAAFEAGFNSR